MTEPLNAAAIVDVQNRHGVKFIVIVIDVFAAIAQRTQIPATRGIDLTPDSSVRNLTRLSTALKELGARIRTDAAEEELPFDDDGRSHAASSVWNLICQYGEFNISLVPSGIAGRYEELVVRAHRMRVDAIDVMVADLTDVIRSKDAAGGPKDLEVLPFLYRFDRQHRETASVARVIRRADGRRVATVRSSRDSSQRHRALTRRRS